MNFSSDIKNSLHFLQNNHTSFISCQWDFNSNEEETPYSPNLQNWNLTTRYRLASNQNQDITSANILPLKKEYNYTIPRWQGSVIYTVVGGSLYTLNGFCSGYRFFKGCNNHVSGSSDNNSYQFVIKYLEWSTISPGYS